MNSYYLIISKFVRVAAVEALVIAVAAVVAAVKVTVAVAGVVVVCTSSRSSSLRRL